MSAVIISLARYRARNAVKRQLRDQGRKLSQIKPREISVLAEAYLAEHRAALLLQALETVHRSPELLKMYEREERDRARARVTECEFDLPDPKPN